MKENVEKLNKAVIALADIFKTLKALRLSYQYAGENVIELNAGLENLIRKANKMIMKEMRCTKLERGERE